MERNLAGVRTMVRKLNNLGLLHGIQEVVMHFDSLQTEYLLQSIWDRTTFVSEYLVTPPTIPNIVGTCNPTVVERVAQHLHKKLRKKETHNNNLGKPPFVAPASQNNTIQKSIKKHWVDKPKVNGSGDTSAILTDVAGFRQILEHALLFHAAIHEFHELDPILQCNYKLLKEKLNFLHNSILAGIYRGDNGIDVRTCKCHAHFHLTEDIKRYGAPMGFDASKGERNLKSWAKRVSKTARKCGQSIFIHQTAKRVSDHLVLQRASQILGEENPKQRRVEAPVETRWRYTRKLHHMLYKIETEEATLVGGNVSKGVETFQELLTKEIRQFLTGRHGPEGDIRIWKEIKIDLGHGNGYHRVRAYHDFDAHGKFYDWVQVKEEGDESFYRPSKVLLLYQTDAEENRALIWRAMQPTEAERRLETNLSARWKMELHRSGLPVIESIPLESIERCILVHEHWKCKNNHHLPETILPPGVDTSIFSIEESYDRYSWLLNFLDEIRWNPSSK
jgi:hypothetical protein